MSYKNLIAFHNIGNSCYLNSALQSLLSCEEFRECIVISNKHKNKDKMNIPFLAILNDISKKRDNPDTPISNPILLKQTLSDCHSFFKDNHQQDCHECLITILDVLHENTKNTDPDYTKILITNNRIIKRIPNLSKEANKQWKDTMNKLGLSFSSYIFSGQIRSCLTCLTCKQDRNNFEIVNNISLSLPESKNIDIIDCFNNYFSTEILKNENKVECEHCKIKTETKKVLSMWRFPKILIIHLKRYIQQPNGFYSRNNSLVEFSPELIFRDKNENKRIKFIYDLTCVVNHFGMSPMGGHYTSIVKHNESDQYDWIHIDDSTIYKYDEDKLVTPAAYILIYRLK